jgi:hypothetical protein
MIPSPPGTRASLILRLPDAADPRLGTNWSRFMGLWCIEWLYVKGCKRRMRMT